MPRDVVIVSTARTPIGKAYRGAFNDTPAQTLAGHAIQNAVARAGVDPAEIDDVLIGAALQQGSTGSNVARQAALRAGLSDSVPAMSIDRQCSSGLMTISAAAGRIALGETDIAVAGGVESVSLVQNDKMNLYRAADPWLKENCPNVYMSMLETAEVVAARYGISRDQQDEYAVTSHQRTAEAQANGRLDAEIAPLASVKKVKHRETGDISDVAVTLTQDEGLRAGTSMQSLSGLKPVFSNGLAVKEGRYIDGG